MNEIEQQIMNVFAQNNVAVGNGLPMGVFITETKFPENLHDAIKSLVDKGYIKIKDEDFIVLTDVGFNVL